METTHVQKLAGFASRLRYDDIPERVINAAKCQVLDMVAAAHSSAASGEASCVLDAINEIGAEDGPATVLATGRRTGISDAVTANAACSIAQDFDDIVWMGHTCHSAVFVPLAVSELLGCSSREFLKAVVIANEIGGRVGASCFLGPLNGQMWTFIHLAGAAAAASSLLGLDTEKTANAISIALTQPNFSLQPGFFRPSSKLLAASVPAVTGMNAAFFAKNGMTGPADIFESPRGFWRRFSFRPLPEMLEDLGKFWVLDTLTIKTYPGCHYFQTALDALERIFGDRGAARLSGVESITIDTTKLACEVSKLAIEAGVDDSRLTPVSVAFDLRLSAAVLLHGGRIGPAELNTSYLQKNARALRSWAGKISVVHDPSLTFEVIRCARRIESGKAATDSFRLWELPSIARKYREFYGSTLMTAGEVARSIKSLSRGRKDAQNSGQAASGLVFPSRVTVRFADGKTVSERVDLPSGSITRPGMQAELEKKFLRSCMKALGSGRAVKAFRIGLDLENESVSRFVKSTSPKS